MGYTVPLRFIRVSQKRSDNRQSDVAICATRITAVMSTEIFQARKTISDERKNGTLINGCGQVKAKSAIFLDNGTVVSSPLTVRKIMTLIEKSDKQSLKRINKKYRVVDVFEDEPDEEMEESPDMNLDDDPDDDFEE